MYNHFACFTPCVLASKIWKSGKAPSSGGGNANNNNQGKEDAQTMHEATNTVSDGVPMHAAPVHRCSCTHHIIDNQVFGLCRRRRSGRSNAPVGGGGTAAIATCSLGAGSVPSTQHEQRPRLQPPSRPDLPGKTGTLNNSEGWLNLERRPRPCRSWQAGEQHLLLTPLHGCAQGVHGPRPHRPLHHAGPRL